MKTHHQYPTPHSQRLALADGPDTVAHAFHRHWPQLKIIFKEQYLVLTDDDLACPAEGCIVGFLDQLARKTGRTRREFETLILNHEVNFPG